MAVGYANGAALSYANWAGILDAAAAVGLVQNITGPGWSRQIGDITSVDAADDILRKKIGSKRLEGAPVTVNFFYDPDSSGLDSPPTTSNLLTLVYPVILAPTSNYTQNMLVESWSAGNVIDDEISMAECVFVPTGGDALDDPTA